MKLVIKVSLKFLPDIIYADGGPELIIVRTWTKRKSLKDNKMIIGLCPQLVRNNNWYIIACCSFKLKLLLSH